MSLLAIALTLALAMTGLRGPLLQQYQNYLVRDMFVSVAQKELEIGPALNTQFPGLRANSAEGSVTLLEPYSGSTGTLLIILRALDDRPYCAEQLLQLHQYHAQFWASGISVVALSQSNLEALEDFKHRHSLDIPLLSDQQHLTAKTLGLMFSHRVAPGALIIGPDNRVIDKVFMADPNLRLDSASLLARAAAALSQ